ncbi:MAG: family 78 glycoside hydrolase catalytic domain [Verrucomicrobia bacterium]|nr:family 78 glycoside hydrolase catalytic domain [Verrucomicrobiota bacterium]
MLLVAGLALVTGTSLFAGDMAPAGLRCEYAEHPLAVDCPRPRLSWIHETQSDRRGLRQSAYRVLVASSADALARDEGDVWDSGRVESDASIQIEYAGRALASRQRCFWKVRTWDQHGQAGPWSARASWTMGLFTTKDWQAQWIQAPATSSMPVFRRAFDLARPVRRAMLYVSGLGQHEVRLNGRKVGAAVIEPSWSNYRKTCYYRASDVTSQVRPGENVIGVLLGNGMYNVAGGRYTKFKGSFGSPKLICQLEVDHPDGSRTVVASDGSWKWTHGPIQFSCTFGGEDYDARAALPGWDSPGYDATGWLAATATHGPGGRLRSEIVEPIQAMITYKPVHITSAGDGIWIYDLGQNFSGWPVLRVRGPAGAKVKLIPGELLDDRGRVSQKSSGGPMWFSYTLKGGAPEEWQPRFTYYGFRYIEVEGAAPADAPDVTGAAPKIEALTGEFLHTAARVCGQFECSNDLVNRIHGLINAAILSNFKSVLTDCPHREKLGWLEVSHLLAPSILYNHEGARFYQKICRDMREAQLPNGMVPDIAPEFTVFSGGFRDSPEWGSACVVNPWILWETYGDRRALEDNFDAMKRYTGYLASRADTQGIVAYGLGDWCDVGPGGPGPSQLTSLGLTSTAMLFNNLTILDRTARLLGRPEEAEAFARRALKTRRDFERAFFHPEQNNYDRNSQAANAIPLTLGIADSSRKAAVLENLVRDIRTNQNRVTAGDVGFVYLVRALADHGRGDVLYDMLVQDQGPGYVYQLKKGATSLVETWDANPATSQNHCMLGHVEEWLYRGLGGIRPDPASPAFKHFVLRPDVPADLEWVRTSHHSMHGTIRSRWRQTSDPAGRRFSWTVVIPPNTSATLFVPARDPAAVREAGGPAREAAGLTFLRTEGAFACFEAGSGTYHFASILNRAPARGW